MKKIVVSLATVVLFGCLAAMPAHAAQKWSFGTSGTGSGPYSWGGVIAKILNSTQDAVRVSSQATAGYNENVLLVANGDMQVGQQAGSGLVDAYLGRGAFKGKPIKNLRLLFPFVLAPCHIATREASGIKTMADLKGKKVNIGLPSMITRVEDEALLRAANIKLSDIKMFQMSTGDGLTALQNKVIDATINYYSAGHGRLMEVAINRRIRLVPVPEDVIQKVEETRGAIVPYTIPANTYKGQNYPVKTFALTNVLFCRADLPENLVYTITKAFWDHLDEFHKYAAFKSLTLKYAYSPKSRVPYHPGALKYFKEIGLVK